VDISEAELICDKGQHRKRIRDEPQDKNPKKIKISLYLKIRHKNRFKFLIGFFEKRNFGQD
jgi:hypothetical protein